MDVGIAPIPPQGARELTGHDDELNAMLQAMGYAVGDGAEQDHGGTDGSDSPE